MSGFTTNNITLTNASSQIKLGMGNLTTLTCPSPSGNRTYTIPDTTTSVASFVMTDGIQTINSNKTFSGTISMTGPVTMSNTATFNGTTTFNSTLNSNVGIQLSSLSGASVLTLSNSKYIIGNILNDNQFLIGNTGASPSPGTIIGTAGQVNVNRSGNNLVLSLASSSSNPTFSTGTFTAASNQLILGNTTINSQSLLSSLVYTIPDAGVNCQFIMSGGTQTIIGNKTFTGSTTFSGIPSNSVLYLNSTGKLSSTSLNTGQILIGNTGNTPIAGNITGAVGEINVTNNPGSIILSLANPLGSNSSPTFLSEKLTVSNNQLSLGALGNNIIINANPTSTTRTYTIPDVLGNAQFVLTGGTQTILGNKTFSGTTNFSSLQPYNLLGLDSSKNLIPYNLNDGEILIGSSSGSPLAKTISGTLGQINVTNGPNAIILSLASSGSSSTTPTFISETLTGSSNQITFGSGNTTILTVPPPLATRVYTIPDVGSNACFIMSSGNQTLGGTTTLSGLTNNSILSLNSNKNIISQTLTNGQILIGSSGNLPVPSFLTGVSGEIKITNSPGSITIGLDGSGTLPTNPSFQSITVTNPSNQIILNVSSTLRSYTIPDVGSNSNFILSDGNQTLSGITTLSSLSSNSILSLDTNKNIISNTLTNGQILIGSSGANPIAATLTGTNNRIIVTSGSGTISLSTPQNIHTSATPTFASEILTSSSNQLTLGTTIISAITPSRTYTMSDVGSDAKFVMTEGSQTINGNKILSGTTNLSNLTSNSILSLNSNKDIINNVLTNGQILIGSSGVAPIAASLLGTSNQVLVTNGSGSITLSIPQNIATTSSPTFTSETLTSSSNQLTLGSSKTTTISAIAPSASRTYIIPDVGSNSTFLLSDGSQSISSVFTFPNLTTNSALYLDSNKQLSSSTLSNGQILIGSDNGIPSSATITGINNQILVTNGANSITLSTPQDIATISSPTFASETLTSSSNQLTLGSSTTTTISAPIPASSRIYTIPDAGLDAKFVMTESNQTINGNKVLSGTTNLSGLTANSLLSLNSSKNIISNVLTNGQILIGSTGLSPVATILTGTNNQILITPGAGSITLSTPQNISVTSSPTFASETLTSSSNQLTLGSSTTTTISAPTPTSSRTYTIPDVGLDAKFVMTESNQTINGNKTFSGTTNLSNLTANSILSLNSTKDIISNVLTNGQILIGSSGLSPVATTLTGTTNQVLVTNGSGSITLSIPQNIATTSSPTFTSETLTSSSNQLTLGTTTISATAPLVPRTYTIPDSGANSSFLLSDGNNTLTGTTNLSGLSSNGILSLSSSKNIISNVLTNGQILIGSTGLSPIAASLLGTSNQILVNSGAGSITLSTPQNINNTATPTFASETLTSSSNQLTLGSSTTTTISATAPVASRTYTIPDSGTNSNFLLSDGNQSINGTITLPSLSANSLLSLNSSKNIISSTLTNGQILIGSSGLSPVAATITGTSNQILVTNSSGTITLSTPQNIATNSTPTFASETLTAASNQLTLGTTNTTTISAPTPVASRIYTIPDAGLDAKFVMTELNQTINGNKTLSGTTNLSNLTANSLLSLNSTKDIISNVLTNGQILIGSTSLAPVAAVLTGTTNQIIVSSGAGTITLSTPQNIATSSTPTFTSETLTSASNQLTLGTTTISATAPLAPRIYTIPDVGSNSNFILADGNNTLTGTTNLSGLTANSILSLNSNKDIISNVLTNGQILIGSSGVAPIAATLTGTTNQILINTGSGSITLSTPQNIHTLATPTFTSETLTATSNQLILGSASTSTISAPTPSSSRVYTIPDTGLDAKFVMTELAQTINGNKTLSGSTILSGLTASSLLSLNSSKNIISNVLTNGQLLIGSSGVNPVAATLTGTTNQIIVSSGAGSITLSTPQNINTLATPTFSSETLTSTSNQLILGTTTTITISAPTPASSRTYTIPDTGIDAKFVMTELAQTINGNKTLTGTTNLSGLTASSLLSLNSNKDIIGNVLTNGQLLIGSTGNSPVAASLTGTSNQIIVTNGSGNITLSTPQNIDTSASPTFGSLILSTQSYAVFYQTATMSLTSSASASSYVGWNTATTRNQGTTYITSNATTFTVAAGGAGVYGISYSIFFTATNGGYAKAYISRGGDSTQYASTQTPFLPALTAAGPITLSSSANILLAVNDTITIQVIQTSGLSLTVGSTGGSSNIIFFKQS